MERSEIGILIDRGRIFVLQISTVNRTLAKGKPTARRSVRLISARVPLARRGGSVCKIKEARADTETRTGDGGGEGFAGELTRPLFSCVLRPNGLRRPSSPPSLVPFADSGPAFMPPPPPAPKSSARREVVRRFPT